MNYTKLNLSQKIHFTGEALSIASGDPELTTVLEGFGYTAERLAEGRALQDTVRSLDAVQQVEYGARIASTARVDQLFQRVLEAYRNDRSIARVVLRGLPGLTDQLRLRGRVPVRRDSVLRSTRHFYQELQNNAEIQALLAPSGFTTDMAEARLADVETLAVAMEVQQIQRAESLIATQRRQEAMAALDDWMAQFIGVARQAFRSDRKQLEKLGIAAK